VHFDDVLTANEEFAAGYDGSAFAGGAARGLALVTCMDARIDPLLALGLAAGDAYVLRNAGAQITADMLTTLVLAVRLLGVKRVMIMAHTNCRMTTATDDEVHAAILADSGADTRSLDFGTIADQRARLAGDVQRLRSSPYLPKDLPVLGSLYDLATGRVSVLVEE